MRGNSQARFGEGGLENMPERQCVLLLLYSLWKKGNRVIDIHDDDSDIVSIFDLNK